MAEDYNQRMKHALTYHAGIGKPWLTTSDHKILPDSIARKVLESAAIAAVVLRDGDKFTVYPKGDTKNWKGEIECEFKRLSPTHTELSLAASPAPQSLHDWYKWLCQLNTQHPTDGFDRLAAAVNRAQVFEFGDVDEARLMKENARAADLANRGFLKLPYECVIYRYTGEKSGRVHLIALQNGTVLQWGWEGRTPTDHLVWPLSLMIATRGTEIRVEVPAPKLQAKRAAKGKSPLPYITYVNAEKYYTAVRNTEARGHHASPVPHLRRGHLRHYASGHTVWIRDMLVNCKSIDEVKPRERYQVIRELGITQR